MKDYYLSLIEEGPEAEGLSKSNLNLVEYEEVGLFKIYVSEASTNLVALWLYLLALHVS